jgi:hypothetical protein
MLVFTRKDPTFRMIRAMLVFAVGVWLLFSVLDLYEEENPGQRGVVTEVFDERKRISASNAEIFCSSHITPPKSIGGDRWK